MADPETMDGESIQEEDVQNLSDQKIALSERIAEESEEPVAAEVPKKKPRRKKSDTDIKKIQCGSCLREFNPAYLNRHSCKPPNAAGTRDGVVEIHPQVIEKPEPGPLAEPPPQPTAIERQVTAADIASFLKREKDTRRAEKVARYSAAMFG